MASDLILCSIFINGKAIKDTYQILSVKTGHAVNAIAEAEIIIAGSLVDGQLSEAFDTNDFTAGNIISVNAGYTSNSLVQIFSGVITATAFRVNAGTSFLSIKCKHKAVAMTFNKNNSFYADKSDSEIITAIISKYALSAKVDTVENKQESVFQRAITDWDFIVSKSRLNGFVITMNDDTITVAKPQLNDKAALSLVLGDTILAFEEELNDANQPILISTAAWNTKTQSVITASSTEPIIDKNASFNFNAISKSINTVSPSLFSPMPLTKKELTAWANAEILFKRLAQRTGTVKIIGNASAKTGTIISLKGVGKNFEGGVFASSVTHEIKDGNWFTVIGFGLNDNTTISGCAVSLSPSSVHGLQIATVQKISKDPASLYRVQVRIASVSENTVNIWARMANFYATANAGSCFLPEIGDEVVLGFLDDEASCPVILGSLYSDKMKPAVDANDDNNFIKSIITKSKLILSFDDQNKTITIKTPGGNSITVNDKDKCIEMKDQNSNSVKLSSDGIILNSNKDIKLTAAGTISLTATQKIAIAAQQDVAVSGINITNTAQVGFTGKGSATAELSASGQTTVKGGIVMIN